MIAHPTVSGKWPSAGRTPPSRAVGSSPTIFEMAKPALPGGLRVVREVVQSVGSEEVSASLALTHHAESSSEKSPCAPT